MTQQQGWLGILVLASVACGGRTPVEGPNDPWGEEGTWGEQGGSGGGGDFVPVPPATGGVDGRGRTTGIGGFSGDGKGGYGWAGGSLTAVGGARALGAGGSSGAAGRHPRNLGGSSGAGGRTPWSNTGGRVNAGGWAWPNVGGWAWPSIGGSAWPNVGGSYPETGGTGAAGAGGYWIAQPGWALTDVLPQVKATQECLACVNTSCPSAQKCSYDPTCGQEVSCLAGACIPGGFSRPDNATADCLVKCISADPLAALPGLEGADCVYSRCARSCL